MNRTRQLALVGYLTAMILLAAPLVDTMLMILPPDPSNLSWRFGSLGLLSRALGVPFLGLLLILSVAAFFEHRKTLQGLAVFSGLAGVIMLGAVALFVLDSVQMRSQVQPEVMTPFDRSWMVGAGKLGMASLVLSFFAVSGWRTAKAGPKKRGPSRKRDRKADLVAGR